MSKTTITLEDDELILLDGKCGPAIQAQVNAAKRRRASAVKTARAKMDGSLTGHHKDS